MAADVGEAVERAGRLDTVHARDRIEPLGHVSAPRFELAPHRFDGLIGARIGVGRQGRCLGETHGISGFVAHQTADGVDQFPGAGRPPQPPARHGERLGQAVDRQRAITKTLVQRGEGDEPSVAVDEVLVDFVGKDQQVGLEDHFGQGSQLIGRVGHARRIGRRVEHQQFRIARCGAELIGRDLKAALGAGVEENRLAAGELDHLRIADPVGGRDQDLVAGIDEDLAGVVKGVLAAEGHDHLVGGGGDVVHVGHLRGDGLAERLGLLGDVLGVAGVEGGLGGVLDELGGVEVRFAGGEADHIDAIGLHLLGLGGDGDRGAGGEGLDTFGQVHGNSCSCLVRDWPPVSPAGRSCRSGSLPGGGDLSNAFAGGAMKRAATAQGPPVNGSLQYCRLVFQSLDRLVPDQIHEAVAVEDGDAQCACVA